MELSQLNLFFHIFKGASSLVQKFNLFDPRYDAFRISKEISREHRKSAFRISKEILNKLPCQNKHFNCQL